MSRKSAADRQHRWLSLVEVTGVVLSEPVLVDTAPAGFRLLERAELARFYREREIRDLPSGSTADPERHWVEFVLGDLLRLQKRYWKIGADIPEPLTAPLPQQGETLRPTRVLYDGGEPVMLLLHVPREQSLDKAWRTNGAWKASPTTKLERLLRTTGVEVGLLTNGDAWRLVIASPSETASWLTWSVEDWGDSPSTLAAFVELLGEARFFAGPRSGTILSLVRASRERQADVADQLGSQARDALWWFVRELDRLDHRSGGVLLRSYSDDDIYASSVALVMRLLFILKAEEMLLLPHGELSYDRSYGLLHLLNRLENDHRINPRKLEDSAEAYPQLLATSRLIHGGSVDPDLNLAPYGGQLFAPSSYPLLEGRAADGTAFAGLVPLPIRDSVVRGMLRSLKYARVGGGAPQWVSYRTLEVEQIGHMYERLLDLRVARAPETDGLIIFKPSATSGTATAIAESTLLRTAPPETIRELVRTVTGFPAKTIERVLGRAQEGAPVLDAIRPLLLPDGIVPPGGRFITEGAARRVQGAHYTPSILTAPIIRIALEPHVFEGPTDGLPRSEWRLRSAQEILELRVADIAMGSGAFLVQVVRYLSDRLVDAWTVAAALASKETLTLPYAERSTGEREEVLLPDDHAERVYWGRRYVAERTIFGVDKNPLAAEMAKLSIWLETMARDRPFTFLDHALRAGDSLVGMDERQLATWSVDRSGSDAPLLRSILTNALTAARALREQLRVAPVATPRDERRKKDLLRDADGASGLIRAAADALVAAESGPGTAAERKKRRLTALLKVTSAQATPQSIGPIGRELLGDLQPFHWALEFPEAVEAGGFDAIVGNPPFLGGSRMSTELGEAYGAFIKRAYPELVGKIDLVIYFFHRAAALLKPRGTLSFLATYKVADGDNASKGLAPFVQAPWLIYDAIKEMLWPGTASVRVSRVSITRHPYSGAVTLNGRPAQRIGPDLRSTIDLTSTSPLAENEGRSYLGAKPDSLGFLVTEEERRTIIATSPEESTVIRRYIIGTDLTKRPTKDGSRWIIDFSGMTEREAESFPHTFALVRDRVLPSRLKLKRKAYRDRWWQYTEPQIEAHTEARKLHRVLGISRVTKYVVWDWIATDHVIADKITLVVSDDDFDFGILNSSVHEVWALRAGGKFGVGGSFSYSPVRCFRTFPYPNVSNENRSAIALLARELSDLRNRLLSERQIGLTSLYNAVHTKDLDDSEIVGLRGLHLRLDAAVVAAYKFPALDLRYSWQEASDEYSAADDDDGESGSEWRYALDPDVREELLRHLLALNRERASADGIKLA